MNVVAAASILDWIAGDPNWFPHPVRLIGRGAGLAEQLLRRPGQSEKQELVAGGILTTAVVAGSYFATARAIAWAHRLGRGAEMEILLAWTCLASRNLMDEGMAVLRAVDTPALARTRLGRIVGRDTHHLSDPEVYRALIETLAESACDGIVAPLTYLAAGGVPLAMAYKAVSTLDSMIGHRDQRYLYFGRVAARLDDVANYLPARLAALAIVIAAGRDSRSAFRIWRRDGAKHKSPNAGQPEAAMAGALQVRLGGENTYAGERIATPLLGAEFQSPELRHAKRALRIVVAVSLLSCAIASVISLRRTGR
ncbi:MAG: adenosylcobinamide-phosphate synthase CbiB [Acidobacteriaceae bacterium]